MTETINILTRRGLYTFDPDSQRIFKDDMYLSRNIAEPIFCGNDEGEEEPMFAGIYLVTSDEIITRTGNIKKVTDISAIKVK